jgi:hypothetical protein
MEIFSKEEIVKKIRLMDALEIDLSADYISRNDPLFYFNVLRCFSAWSEALEAAHLSYNQYVQANTLRKWSSFRILSEIRKHLSENHDKFYRSHLPLYSAARREFGSWRVALQEAGRGKEGE